MRQPGRNILGLTALAGAIGLMLPNVWLALAIKSRKDKVSQGMPDSLDLWSLASKPVWEWTPPCKPLWGRP